MEYILQRPNYRGEWITDTDYGTFTTKKRAEAALKSARQQYPVWAWRISAVMPIADHDADCECNDCEGGPAWQSQD